MMVYDRNLEPAEKVRGLQTEVSSLFWCMKPTESRMQSLGGSGPGFLKALFQSLLISLKVASLERRLEKMCFSCSTVVRPMALGMILAVFSFVTLVTDRMGICN